MGSRMIMKIDALTIAKSKPYFQAISAIFLSLSLLSACQKTPEPETDNETISEAAVQTTPVPTNINVDTTANNGDDIANPEVGSEQDVSLTELENDLGATDSAVNNTAPAPAPNPEQAIKGAQITDVRYKNAAGESLSVVFETSAAGVLNAIISLPNKPKMTLSAPEGQGNNPTYRTTDGSIQLVSHAGGGSIDFIKNNKVTSFDAVSAEAEVITE